MARKEGRQVTKNAPGPRAIKLADVRNGRITPEDAEKWAKDQGQEPFERKPVLPADEIMALEKWTAPMAAAWFIWRSPDAVRDQWDKARQGWTIWERLPGRRMPNSRGRMAGHGSRTGHARGCIFPSRVCEGDRPHSASPPKRRAGREFFDGQPLRPHETSTWNEDGCRRPAARQATRPRGRKPFPPVDRCRR
jgi:hypothetical protein